MSGLGLLSATRALGGIDGTEPDDLLEHARGMEHFDRLVEEVRHPLEANAAFVNRMIPNAPAPIDSIRENDRFMARLVPGYRSSGFQVQQRQRQSQVLRDYLDDHFRRKWGLEGWVAGG